MLRATRAFGRRADVEKFYNLSRPTTAVRTLTTRRAGRGAVSTHMALAARAAAAVMSGVGASLEHLPAAGIRGFAKAAGPAPSMSKEDITKLRNIGTSRRACCAHARAVRTYTAFWCWLGGVCRHQRTH